MFEHRHLHHICRFTVTWRIKTRIVCTVWATEIIIITTMIAAIAIWVHIITAVVSLMIRMWWVSLIVLQTYITTLTVQNWHINNINRSNRKCESRSLKKNNYYSSNNITLLICMALMTVNIWMPTTLRAMHICIKIMKMHNERNISPINILPIINMKNQKMQWMLEIIIVKPVIMITTQISVQ